MKIKSSHKETKETDLSLRGARYFSSRAKRGDLSSYVLEFESEGQSLV